MKKGTPGTSGKTPSAPSTSKPSAPNGRSQSQKVQSNSNAPLRGGKSSGAVVKTPLAAASASDDNAMITSPKGGPSAASPVNDPLRMSMMSPAPPGAVGKGGSNAASAAPNRRGNRVGATAKTNLSKAEEAAQQRMRQLHAHPLFRFMVSVHSMRFLIRIRKSIEAKRLADFRQRFIVPRATFRIQCFWRRVLMARRVIGRRAMLTLIHWLRPRAIGHILVKKARKIFLQRIGRGYLGRKKLRDEVLSRRFGTACLVLRKRMRLAVSQRELIRLRNMREERLLLIEMAVCAAHALARNEREAFTSLRRSYFDATKAIKRMALETSALASKFLSDISMTLPPVMWDYAKKQQLQTNGPDKDEASGSSLAVPSINSKGSEPNIDECIERLFHLEIKEVVIVAAIAASRPGNGDASDEGELQGGSSLPSVSRYLEHVDFLEVSNHVLPDAYKVIRQGMIAIQLTPSPPMMPLVGSGVITSINIEEPLNSPQRVASPSLVVTHSAAPSPLRAGSPGGKLQPSGDGPSAPSLGAGLLDVHPAGRERQSSVSLISGLDNSFLSNTGRSSPKGDALKFGAKRRRSLRLQNCPPDDVQLAYIALLEQTEAIERKALQNDVFETLRAMKEHAHWFFNVMVFREFVPRMFASILPQLHPQWVLRNGVNLILEEEICRAKIHDEYDETPLMFLNRPMMGVTSEKRRVRMKEILEQRAQRLYEMHVTALSRHSDLADQGTVSPGDLPISHAFPSRQYSRDHDLNAADLQLAVESQRTPPKKISPGRRSTTRVHQINENQVVLPTADGRRQTFLPREYDNQHLAVSQRDSPIGLTEDDIAALEYSMDGMALESSYSNNNNANERTSRVSSYFCGTKPVRHSPNRHAGGMSDRNLSGSGSAGSNIITLSPSLPVIEVRSSTTSLSSAAIFEVLPTANTSVSSTVQLPATHRRLSSFEANVLFPSSRATPLTTGVIGAASKPSVPPPRLDSAAEMLRIELVEANGSLSSPIGRASRGHNSSLTTKDGAEYRMGPEAKKVHPKAYLGASTTSGNREPTRHEDSASPTNSTKRSAVVFFPLI